MRAPSLRLRLLLVSAASIAVALLIAGIAISSMFSNHIERSRTVGLESQLARLVALIDPDLASPHLTQSMSDPRYETPAGGIYWQISDPTDGTVTRSRSLWDTVLKFEMPLPEDGTVRVAKIAGPDSEEALALGRRLSFERDGAAADRVLEVFVAEDTDGIRAADAAFQAELLLALAIVALVLIGATWVQVTLGLSPLDTIKRGVAAIRTGRAKALDGNYPAEVTPLVSEVNDLLATQDRSIEFARTRAADLAHGLKTSLTLLNGEAHELRRSGNATAAAAIENLTAGMSEVIDHQLRLSRLRHRSRSDLRSTLVAGAAGKVIAALKMTPEGRTLDWRVDIPEAAAIALDMMDLTELLGVFLENATKWARHRVDVSARSANGKVELTVTDDGPGLDSAALAKLGQRGRRIDETRPGSGLGLAIGREIVTLNGGSLSFGRSPAGGLQVDVVLNAGSAG